MLVTWPLELAVLDNSKHYTHKLVNSDHATTFYHSILYIGCRIVILSS